MTTHIRTFTLSPTLLLASLGCAPPCTDDGLHQDCDEAVLGTMATDETDADDDDDDDDDDETSSGTTALDDADPSLPEESSSDDGPSDEVTGTHSDDSALDDHGSMDESSTGSDRGEPSADEYESCAMAECVSGSACTDVADLDDYDPFCSPACETDDDCPQVDGGVESWCSLVPDGELDAQRCVLVCIVDDAVLGDCPGAMECVDVPGQTTQIGVCMWQ
jgi:hypothetical protein